MRKRLMIGLVTVAAAFGLAFSALAGGLAHPSSKKPEAQKPKKKISVKAA